jgi:hypothetical protein
MRYTALELGANAKLRAVRQSSTMILRMPHRKQGSGAGGDNPSVVYELFDVPECQNEVSCAWFDQIAFLGLSRDVAAQ